MMGSLPTWQSRIDQDEALEALERDALAASTRESMQAKFRTVGRALAGWGISSFPPSLSSVRALGATLKRGGIAQQPATSGCIKPNLSVVGIPGVTS